MKKLSLRILMSLSVITLSLSSIGCSNDSVEETISEPTKAATLEELIKTPNESSKLATTYTIKRYVFNRSNGANGLGHVGVGVEIRTTNPTSITYYFGGVENTTGAPAVGLGGNNGGWKETSSTGAAMFAVMRSSKYGYNRYKFEKTPIAISSQRVTNTINEINYLPSRGYFLAGNNCLNATYDVLNQGGGLFIPAPSASTLLYAPNTWYASITSPIGWSGSNNL